MLAIWRLATIIEHQAATWPVHDPTWYGPISIMLAVLEVDFAAICASIPIFWPVLEERWGSIFITQEIKITHEERYFHEDDVERFSSHTASRDGGGSEIELKRSESGQSHGSTNYNDMFVMRSVDPLRSPTYGDSRSAAIVESAASSNTGKKWLL